jgi:phage-related protein
MKPVHFTGSARKDLKDFPEDARRDVGFALHQAQLGGKSFYAVPMVGFGSAKVLEVVIDDDGETYRTVYTVKLKHAIYVLHAYHKKSKRGIKTPQADINLIKSRLKLAEDHHATKYTEAERKGA